MTAGLIIVGVVAGLYMLELDLLTFLFGESRLLAIVAGGMIGALWARLIKLQRRVQTLERRPEAAAHQPGRPEPGTESAARTAGPSTAGPPAKPTRASAAAPARSGPGRQPPASPAPAGTAISGAAPPSRSGMLIESGIDWLKRWFREGNVPVKIGVLVSFVGVAALLRYATEQGWLSAPIELRLVGVAAAAIGALLFAWRQRHRRRLFALALQGGAIGVLVLTVFAAFRLYDVVPASAAFALLIVLVGATGVLAVAQNAVVLGILALVAGFAAPILVTTGDGNHVVLFSYYAVLNLCVFGIAWQRRWALLNRLGFAFTFVIGTLWGVLSYQPALYASTQPFLILFFAMYLAIPIIHARRGDSGQAGKLDVVLVFGLPLFAFPLQVALLDAARLPVAFAALSVAVVYALSAVLLMRRWNVRPLGDTHAVLALGFATLAVPFAFSGPTIAVIWALEGAALVWFGIHQSGRLTRLAGLALQAAAALAWLVTAEHAWKPGIPVVNELFLGGLAVAAAAAVSAWRYDRGGASIRLLNLLALWSLGAWLLAAIVEILRHVPAADQPDALLVLAALTAALAALAHRTRPWLVTGAAPAALLAWGMVVVAWQEHVHDWPFGGRGAPAWALFIGAAWIAQQTLVGAAPRWRGLAALAVHGAVLVMLGAVLLHLAESRMQLGAGWLWLASGAPLMAAGALLHFGRRAPLTPAPLPDVWQRRLQGTLLIVLLTGLLFSLGSAGHARPLAFIPLLNPLELAQIAAVALLAGWVLQRADRSTRGLLVPGTAGLVFLVMTLMVLRAVHHLAHIEWSQVALLTSSIGQSALSVGWMVVGVIAWIVGSRRQQRTLWWCGAILLGVVLAKLVLIDRLFLSTVAGIVSFLAFGLLSIAVGYLAPAPPADRREVQT